MITTVQSYQLNNKTVVIDLAKIPELSSPSKSVFRSLGANLPEALRTAAPLADRVRSIDETAQMLQEAKNNSTKNKVIAFLKTALVVALVAGVITACVFGGVIGIIAGSILGYLAYTFLTVFLYCDSGGKIKNLEMRLPNYSNPWYFPENDTYDPRALIPLLGGGMIMPLFEAYTRESRLERVLKQQIASVNETLSKYRDQNNQILPLAYQFSKDQSSELLNGLSRKIEQLEKSFASMKQLSERSEAGENELRARILAHQNAHNELSAVAEFYRQFDAN